MESDKGRAREVAIGANFPLPRATPDPMTPCIPGYSPHPILGISNRGLSSRHSLNRTDLSKISRYLWLSAYGQDWRAIALNPEPSYPDATPGTGSTGRGLRSSPMTGFYHCPWLRTIALGLERSPLA